MSWTVTFKDNSLKLVTEMLVSDDLIASIDQLRKMQIRLKRNPVTGMNEMQPEFDDALAFVIGTNKKVIIDPALELKPTPEILAAIQGQASAEGQVRSAKDAALPVTVRPEESPASDAPAS